MIHLFFLRNFNVYIYIFLKNISFSSSGNVLTKNDKVAYPYSEIKWSVKMKLFLEQS